MDMDKDDFKKRLGEFFKEKNVKTIRQLEPGMVVICTLAKDFDPKSNDYWDSWGNKSKVRDDVRCCGCCEPLAVSNWVYRQYVVMAEKPRPYCMECAGPVIEAETAAEAKAEEEKKKAEQLKTGEPKAE
jgi:hypothetical protein